MHIRTKIRAGSFLLLTFLACAMLIADGTQVLATVPYITERVNLTYSGGQMATGNIQDPPILSQDGRYVAFATNDPNIVMGDTNGKPDVFVRDRKLGTTVRANLDSAGAQLPFGYSGEEFRMSANGRFILFEYRGSIDPHGSNGKFHVYLRDLRNNTTEMVSLTSAGGLPDNTTSFYDISADGRYIAFSTSATNIVAGDNNNETDVFIRDRKLGTTALLSKTTAGVPGDAASLRPIVSCDGSYVAFESSATNLVAGDTNGKTDIFLVDRTANSIITDVTVGGNNTSQGYLDMSCNGQTLILISAASNLVPGDTNNASDIFAYNMIDGTFQRVNLDSAGNQTAGNMNLGLESVDFSGRYVLFSAPDDTLVSGDTNGVQDIFLRDLIDGTTQIISKRSAAAQSADTNIYPALSLDGREAVYTSWDNGLVTGDTNGIPDIFVSKTGI